MSAVVFDEVSRTYPGAASKAVDDLSLSVDDGEFLVLVGPSGCGKSTTLRMLAGLEPVDSGRILIGDDDVTDLQPRDRDIAMIFQSYALYPHLTVERNIGFGLKVNKVPKHEISRRVLDVARMLDLEGLLDRKPSKLSGGQRQRVAMGRAIVREARVFLMDEPLSNLDAKLRVQTRGQIAALQRRLGITTIYVTHDQTEAMTMGDRVAVLRDGLLQQCAPPEELFSRPLNVFVAGFIGSPAMNLAEVPVRDDEVTLGSSTLRLSRAQLSSLRGPAAVIGVRPEGFEFVADGGTELTVDLVEYLGSDAFLYCSPLVPGGEPVVVRAPEVGRHAPGDRIRLAPRRNAVHVFDAASGERLADSGQ